MLPNYIQEKNERKFYLGDIDDQIEVLREEIKRCREANDGLGIHILNSELSLLLNSIERTNKVSEEFRARSEANWSAYQETKKFIQDMNELDIPASDVAKMLGYK
ncbi:MAG: hypothetical protein GY827_04705 [Cytophagales bacterium]|nr:hypothetical protein [Cytophagales bacterium]